MPAGGERALVEVVAGTMAGGIALLATAKALGMEELHTLRNLLPGRAGARSARLG